MCKEGAPVRFRYEHDGEGSVGVGAAGGFV